MNNEIVKTNNDFFVSYKETKFEYSTTICINDLEHACVIVYRNEGDWGTHPDVVIESCKFTPCDGLVIDLYEDGYAWLMTGEQEYSIKTEIEGDIIQRHNQGMAGLSAA